MTGVSNSGPASQSLRCQADGPEQQATAVPGSSAAASDASDAVRTQNALEIAKDLVADLRAELPRIDARAAAGVALTAAVLVGVVTQVRLRMPVFAVAVAAAAFLTVSLLLFLMVLLPTPTLPLHQSLVRSRPSEADEEADDMATDRASRNGWMRLASRKGRRNPQVRIEKFKAKGGRLASELASESRAHYHATVAVQIADQVRTKQRLLTLAFINASIGLAALALGATWALLLGWG
jgi:hypothetical protein